MKTAPRCKKKLVIFDMDGLMIDSEKLTCNTFAQVLRSMGYNGYDENMHSVIMGRNQRSIKHVMKDKYGSDFPYEDFWEKSHEILDAQLFEHVDKKAGLDELLQFLIENH